jgi:hypothetical protein
MDGFRQGFALTLSPNASAGGPNGWFLPTANTAQRLSIDPNSRAIRRRDNRCLQAFAELS